MRYSKSYVKERLVNKCAYKKLKNNFEIPHTNGVTDDCRTATDEPMTWPVID